MNPYNNLQFYNHGGNAMNALAQGMQFGDQLRQQKEQRERQQATDEAYRQAYQGNPEAPNALLATDPRAAFEMRGSIQEMQASREQQQRAQLAKVADLLDNSTDEASYQRNLAAAQALNLDVSTAPPNYDPEFIATQSAIAKAVLNNDPELPLIGQEVLLRGLQPGTPEFQEEIGRILKSKYSTVKTVPYTQNGGVVGYDIAGGSITPIIVPNDGTQLAGSAVGQPKQPTSKEQYDALPPGSQYVAPDGSVRVKGGSAGNGTGNFQ